MERLANLGLDFLYAVCSMPGTKPGQGARSKNAWNELTVVIRN